MFSFIAGIVSTLFGGSGTAEKSRTFAQDAATGIGKWVDEQQFTDQEKSEINLETGKMVLEAIKATQNENSVRSVTRRYLAWAVTAYMLIWATVAMVCAMLGMNAMVETMLDVVKRFYLGEAFTAVMAFYFMANIFRK